jgi:chemotaxis methyl-accepting protein methylase/signal transduction histidine kinase/chemotaxis response regulator CheB
MGQARKKRPAGKRTRAAKSATAAEPVGPKVGRTVTRTVADAFPHDADDTFPIVGIGASAGGLEAFTQLLSHLPSDSGMAFVLIQHLDPTRASFLVEALSRATKMPVVQAEAGALVERDHVYVIPPNADVGIAGGKLSLQVRQVRQGEGGAAHLPVDSFLRALAKERGNRAIAVVLSGTASDGTEGLRAIKAENGITLAQDPRSAKFGGMPRSAVEAGVVDHCLPIPALAQELLRLGRHPYVVAGAEAPPGRDDATLAKIFAVVRSGAGVDFGEYKSPTVERRIARRMALARVDDLTAYLRTLESDPQEVRALYEDVLIHVTSFFRDPEVFETLKTRILPEILRDKAEGVPLRIWVAGCSTGEEVYSLAIVVHEHLEEVAGKHPIQIFGSDLSEKSIERARAGIFPDSAMREVSDGRRRRFFTKVEGGYRINKLVRDLCVFVKHDLARDPPFSKLDLASCRNVLIYFDQALQKRVIPTFHYCLRQPGFLLLGRTEAISGFSQLFSPVDKANKIFARTAVASLLHFAPRTEAPPAFPLTPLRTRDGQPALAVDLSKQLDRMMLSRYAPPGVLVTEKLEVLQFRGQTGAYLQPAPGEPQNNLIKMARPGLLAPLRAAMAQVRKDRIPVRTPVEVDQNGELRSCELVVLPFNGLTEGQPREDQRLFLVLFETPSTEGATKRPGKAKPASAKERGRLFQAEHELSATKEYLQAVMEEHSHTTDDLGSANEELISGNEELQSMNEELETAKEELQSTNEELVTVNDELHSRNQEVSLVNSDLINLLSTVDIPLLIVDRERRIRRFTPKARSILNVVPRDVGRPFDDLRPNLVVPDLDAQIAKVIERTELRESEVQDREGRWYRLQIRPYHNSDERVDGAILSLVDIDALKHLLTDSEAAKGLAERANRTKDEFLATLSHELRTPLSTMLLQAQLIGRNHADNPKLVVISNKIERGIRMQVQLIDDLLDVSRIVTDKMEMTLESVDLAEVVKAALEGVAMPAARKPVKLTVTLDATLGRLWGNAMRLQQVVSNLLTNAVKFTPENGEVTVTLERADGRALLKVSDTGRGIEPKFLPHLFRRFSQEDSSVTRSYGGLGLGLAIAHHLVELHGGTIQAESAGAGKGATFLVSLPFQPLGVGRPADEPRTREPALSAPSDDSTSLQRLADLRVLVVDDDSGAREAIAEMLQDSGAQVRVADSAAAGLAAVEDFRPAVVLCDIAMPGEDGYSFIRRMRALGKGRGGVVPALALTALASDEDRRRAISAGFQMHVSKPVDIRGLTDVLASLSHAARLSTGGQPLRK